MACHGRARRRLASGEPQAAARLVQHVGLFVASRRRRFSTTVRNPQARQAPDLAERNFTAERPNQLCLADITYVPT